MAPSPTSSGRLAGRTLGPYSVLALLGAGGMGEVYRAHDPRLRRDVAIKVLPADVASDPTALARFRREARAVAALSHPNILSIHELDADGEIAYAVAELLEGETLRQRIRRGPLGLREALAIAVDTCGGLAAAHAHGIVHRDIKPENLFITASGTVKVLDFGLARATAPLATTESTVTAAGVVVGTVGYMSPEQIRAEPVAPATDIFSFGCVLYEMLRGASPFDRPTAAETLSAILRDEPPSLVEQVPGVPASVEALVLHCLEKRPADRFQSTADLLFALRAAQLSVRRVSGAVEDVAASAPRSVRRWIPWAVVAVAVAAALLLTLFSTDDVAPGRAEQFRQLTFEHGLISNARFGAEGRNVIFSASWDGRPSQIFVRLLDQLDAVPTGPPDAYLVSSSASGELAIRMSLTQNAAFGYEGTLARMPALGGAPRQLAVAVSAADWMPGEGAIAVVTDSDDRQTLDCGQGMSPYETRGWISDLRVAPKGNLVAFLEHGSRDAMLGHIVIYDCRSGVRRELAAQRNHLGLAWHPQRNEIWFGEHGGLRAVNLDTGAERTVLPLPESVRLHDIAADGRVLLSQETQRMRQAVARLPDGVPRDLSWMAWSLVTGFTPDGKSIVFSDFTQEAGREAIAAMRAIDGSAVVRLGEGFVLGASPDGRWVVATNYASGGASRIVLLPLAAGEARTLPAHGIQNHEMGTFLPDGQHVVFVGREAGHGNRLYRQPISGGPPTPISGEGVGLSAVVASPNGAYVAANLQDGPWLFPVAGGEPRPVPGAGRGDLAAGWTRDSCCVYVRGMTREVTLRRVDIATGVAQRVATVRPPDLSGVLMIGPMAISPDESTAAFSYFRSLSSLYLVTRLQ